MKKILISLLTAAVVFSAVSCTGKVSEKNNAEEAKKVAEEFLDDYSEFKLDDAAKLFDGEIDLGLFSGVNSKDEFTKAYSKNLKPTAKQKSQGITEEFVVEQCGKITDMMDIKCEITDAKETDDNTVEVTFEAKLTKPDFNLISKNNYAEKAAKEVGFDNNLTADDADEKMGEVYKKSFELMIEDLEESVEEKTADGVIVLKQDGDKWVIDKNDSKIDGKRFEQRLKSVKDY